MTTFNVDFGYGYTINIDGVDHIFDGKVSLIAYYNGSWELDDVTGTLDIDPDDGSYVFDLEKSTSLTLTVMRWLRNDSKFRDYADDQVYHFRHD
jgi:hypothetical protein